MDRLAASSKESYHDEDDDMKGTQIEGPQNSIPQTKSVLTRYNLQLIASLFLNFVLLTVLFQSHRKLTDIKPHSLEKSRFAGLERNIPRPWLPFHIDNDTEQDALWANTALDAGNVALDDTYARAMGLPRAQRFPWDEDKGLYFINGFHNLHCIMRLRQSLVEFQRGQPQTEKWHHVKHCLMVLRDEILCDASDTPRYTGFQPPLANGLGQVRMCRDWSALEEWGRQRTACWKPVGHRSDPGYSELDRYRFCPPGSPYEEMATTLGFDKADGLSGVDGVD